MFAIALQIILLFALSTLPTLLYPQYAQEFHLSELMLTILYALYVVGTLTTLLFFGRLSDMLGRRRVALAAISLAILATILFILANNAYTLAAARIVSGFAVGLSSGTAIAWMRDMHGANGSRAATLKSVILNIFGLGFGPLLAGVTLGLYPHTQVWPYAIFLMLLAGLLVVIRRTRETVTRLQAVHLSQLKPRIGVPASLRMPFLGPAIAIFVAFSLVGFYSAITPNLLASVLHIHNQLINGLIIFELFLMGIFAVFATIRWQNRTVMRWGMLLVLPALLCIALSDVTGSIGLLLLGTALGGCGVGLAYRSSLEIVNQIAPTDQRAAMVSALFVVGNISISIPVMGIGLMATSLTTPLLANVIFAAVLAVLACVGIALNFHYAVKGY
jgi:MFS family permease